jgi:hypothetical protein
MGHQFWLSPKVPKSQGAGFARALTFGYFLSWKSPKSYCLCEVGANTTCWATDFVAVNLKPSRLACTSLPACFGGEADERTRHPAGTTSTIRTAPWGPQATKVLALAGRAITNPNPLPNSNPKIPTFKLRVLDIMKSLLSVTMPESYRSCPGNTLSVVLIYTEKILNPLAKILNLTSARRCLNFAVWAALRAALPEFSQW